VTLTDENSRETYAECLLSDLEQRNLGNIQEGMTFFCFVKKKGNDTIVSFQPIEYPLSQEEQKNIQEYYERKFADADRRDNYK